MSTKQQAQKQLDKIQAYKDVFGTAQGKIVLDDLMQMHYVLNSTFDKDANTNKIILNEGERNVVLRILSLMKMNTKKLQQRINSHEFED